MFLSVDLHRIRLTKPALGKIIAFEVNVTYCQSQWSVKCTPRVPDQGASLLRMSSTITMQGFIDLAIIEREDPTLVKF